MLTKEERNAIAERMSEEFDYTENDEFYEALIGEEIPDNTTWATDCKVVRNRLIELCDTSNMVELPLDKDGEVIRAGDTVYDKDGDVAEVGGYYYNNGTCKIIIPYGQNGCYINVLPNELTHKKPVTIASLVSEIRHILAKEDINEELSEKIWALTDLIEMSGDSDD